MDELLGKKVPFSAQAEQAVIGSVLIDPDCIPSVMERLRADEFYGKLNRDIYDTVYSMFAYGMTVDPVTVLGQMRVRGVYQDNCEQYMAEVMRMTPTAANVLEYAVKLCSALLQVVHCNVYISLVGLSRFISFVFKILLCIFKIFLRIAIIIYSVLYCLSKRVLVRVVAKECVRFFNSGIMYLLCSVSFDTFLDFKLRFKKCVFRLKLS